MVIGVHTPEFTFEKDADNVRRAAKEIGVDYPIAIDSNYDVWHAFNNQFWLRALCCRRAETHSPSSIRRGWIPKSRSDYSTVACGSRTSRHKA